MMGEPSAKRAFYRSPAFRVALVYLAACAVAVVWSEAGLDRYIREAWRWWHPAPHPAREKVLQDLRGAMQMVHAANVESGRAAFGIELLTTGYLGALVVMPFLAALGTLARTLARARMRAGQADPLARARAFAKKHAALTFASPGMMWLAYEAVYYVRHNPNPRDLRVYLVSLAVAAPTVFLAHLVMSRLALPALLAPTLERHGETEDAVLDDFEFAAVAVTREARFAVKGLAFLSVAMVAALVALPTVDGRATEISIALYVPIALVSALYFRRASRIAVGLDGIHVHGSSRSRFYAFSDLDDVRTNGIAIELLRGGRAVLRLQLHGPDAARRDALTQRLSAAVARASEERDQPVTRFVNGATREDLSRAAEGASSYRHAAVSRDQLWAALEGPSVASDARLAAAEALAGSTDPAERARLRVATERCAEPSVRARMHDLLEDEEDDRAPAPLARRARLGG